MIKNKTPIIIFLLVCQFINLLNFSLFFECVLLLFLLLINKTLKTSALGLFGIVCSCWCIVTMILVTDQPIGLAIECGLSAIFAYLIGFNCVDKSEDIAKINKNATAFTIVPIISMAIYEVLNWLARSVYQTDTGEGYSALYQQLLHRNSYNIWNGALIHSTVAQQYLIAIVCLLPFIVSYFSGKKRMALLAVYAVSTVCLLDLGSRTSVFIAIIVIVLFTIQSIFRRNVSKKNLLRFFVLAIVGVVLLVVYNEKIIDYVTNTTIAQRVLYSNSGISGAFDDNSRFDAYIYLFENMGKYPFGGMPGYFRENSSAHNQFLNFYQLGGIVPFVTYIVFFIGIAYRTINVWKSYNNQGINAKLFFYVMLGIFFICMLESPYSSNPVFNAFSMFFFGIADSSYSKILATKNQTLLLKESHSKRMPR